MPSPGLKALLATLVLAAACSDPTQPPVDPTKTAVRELLRFPDCEGPATSVDPAFDVTLPLETYLRAHELFAALAKELPGGFAGVFHDKDQPVLLLTDPAQSSTLKEALAPYALNLSPIDLARAEVRPARWDFSQLSNWYTYIFRHTPVGTTPGITRSDTDVALNRILVRVESVAARDRVVNALRDVGLPCDLIVLEIE